jgi:hypothetical protein
MSKPLIITLSIAGAIAVVVVIVIGIANMQLGNLLPAGATKTPEFRASYIDSTKKSCVSSASSANKSATPEQVASYCDCMANGSADLLTDDDVRYMMNHIGSIPPGFEQRLQPLLQQCLNKALGK